MSYTRVKQNDVLDGVIIISAFLSSPKKIKNITHDEKKYTKLL